MQKPVIILDPGHGGLTSFFYDLDNGVRLPYSWDEVRELDPLEKSYFSKEAAGRWRAGELVVEPRFYFERKGRKVTWGDPGNVSPLDPRICEKDLVLDLARSMHREIGRKLLVKATRDRDGYVAGSSRVAYANRLLEKFDSETFVLSLHTKSSPDPEERGMRLRPTAQVSTDLLESFEEALVQYLRAVGARGVPVEVVDRDPSDLTGLEMPALTVAVGFLSNIADAQRLLERPWRLELARILSHTAISCLTEGPRSNTVSLAEAIEHPTLTDSVVLSGSLA